MADLVVGTVTLTNKGPIDTVVFGETVAEGELVYKKADDKYWKAINTTEAAAAAVGMCLFGGAADDYGIIAKTGCRVDVTTAVLVGDQYFVSDTAGGMATLEADWTGFTTPWRTNVGHAITTTVLLLDFAPTGVQAV